MSEASAGFLRTPSNMNKNMSVLVISGTGRCGCGCAKNAIEVVLQPGSDAFGGLQRLKP